jgi:hypothetical protein
VFQECQKCKISGIPKMPRMSKMSGVPRRPRMSNVRRSRNAQMSNDAKKMSNVRNA